MGGTVGIVDYGIGNLKSVANAVSHLGAVPVVSDKAASLMDCERLILPGVGAFQAGKNALEASGLRTAFKDYVASGRPTLGICLGMQLLFEDSDEFGVTEGLGLIPGKIRKFQHSADGSALRLPNVGWLPLTRAGDEPLLTGIEADARFYFIHSYAAEPDLDATIAHSSFEGIRFTSMARKDNLVGTQFHPEKSGVQGLRLLQNFLAS